MPLKMFIISVFFIDIRIIILGLSLKASLIINNIDYIGPTVLYNTKVTNFPDLTNFAMYLNYL